MATTAKPQQVRATWSSDMVACLLELRLGSLLPRFSSGRAPVQLQEAWNLLQSEFALETGVDVNVQQLKNKYHQLKREYEETKRRIEAHQHSAAGSTSSTDDLLLPVHWDIVEDAFGKSDGLRGVSFFRRGVKVESTASPPSDKQLDASPAASRSVSRAQSVAPVLASLSTAASTPVYSAAAAVPSGASAGYRSRSFPASATPPLRPEWSASAPAPVAKQTEPEPLRSSRKRPLETEDESEPQTAAPPAKTPKLDFAQALVAAAGTIANALVESAKIVAASVASSAELAAKVDEQMETQTRMLALLKQSSQRQDALLQALGQQQPLRASSNSSKRSS